MVLRFFNTLTRSKDKFVPVEDGKVSMYTCGPTVYNYVHLGNLRAMMTYDIVKRYLKYKGFDIKHVMNITDVDDKIIKGCKRTGKSLKDFTEHYTDIFLEDIDFLRVQRADVMPKATEEIDEMVRMVKLLLEKGYAYRTDSGDIYYKISKFKDYGRLARLDIKNLKSNAGGRLNRSDEYDKEDAQDFALWKAYSDDDGDIYWETDLGKGRPGWHLECSAMSRKYIGGTMDIHMGGVDLIFPHHTNEIAQSEAAYGDRFVNYWLHNAHLFVDGAKMSKSLGNFITTKDIRDKYKPEVVRMFFLSSHYRSKVDFNSESIDLAKASLDRIYTFLDNLVFYKGKAQDKGTEDDGALKLISASESRFEKAMDDDVSTPEALESLFTFIKDINRLMEDRRAIGKNMIDSMIDHLYSLDTVFSILPGKDSIGKSGIDAEIQSLIDKREQARKGKEWAEADRIRDHLDARGIILEDTEDGVRWRRRKV